jgi:predicted regulator of Ras-like GTPase activity (Roadblock/LC7/MglB family)
MTEEERLRSGRLVYYAEDIDRINQILDRLLHLSDARCAMLVDKEGHLITKRGEVTRGFDDESISALVAGSFAATKEMAKLLGEEEFSVLFHQGVKDSIQLTLVADRALLAVMFDDRTTIGMVRLYASETSTKVAELLKVAAQREPVAGMGAQFTEEATKRLSDVFGDGEEKEGKEKRPGYAPAGRAPERTE